MHSISRANSSSAMSWRISATSSGTKALTPVSVIGIGEHAQFGSPSARNFSAWK